VRSDRHPEVTACFLLDHPKFVSFVDPIVERLGRENVLEVALTEPTRAAVGGRGVATASLREREQPSSKAIGDALWEFPWLLTSYDEILELLRERRPACAVVVEGNAPLDEVTNQACRALGIPCLAIQQGWSPIVHSGFRDLSFTRMAVWGEGFREALAPYSPEQRFEVVGNPVLAAEPAETVPGPERTAISFFLQPHSPLIGEEHQRRMRELILRAASSFPEDRVLVREHPGAPLSEAAREQLGRAPNIRLMPAAVCSLPDLIRASRVAVSIYSTSLLEAAALGTPPLVFNPTSMPRYWPDLEELGVGVEVDDVDAALRRIDRLLHDDGQFRSFAPRMASFREHYFAGATARAPDLIADLVRELR
jgi:hypothetical protein